MPFKFIQEARSQGRCSASYEGSWSKGKKVERFLGSGSICYLFCNCLGQICRHCAWLSRYKCTDHVVQQEQAEPVRRYSQSDTVGRVRNGAGHCRLLPCQSWAVIHGRAALHVLARSRSHTSGFLSRGRKEDFSCWLFQTTSGCMNNWLPMCQLALLLSRVVHSTKLSSCCKLSGHGGRIWFESSEMLSWSVQRNHLYFSNVDFHLCQGSSAFKFPMPLLFLTSKTLAANF